VQEEIKPLPVINSQVGLDLGLKSMVILSTGQAVGNPKFYAKDEKRLAKAQRRHAKKKKGSKNREKARRKVARVHKPRQRIPNSGVQYPLPKNLLEEVAYSWRGKCHDGLIILVSHLHQVAGKVE